MLCASINMHTCVTDMGCVLRRQLKAIFVIWIQNSMKTFWMQMWVIEAGYEVKNNWLEMIIIGLDSCPIPSWKKLPWGSTLTSAFRNCSKIKRLSFIRSLSRTDYYKLKSYIKCSRFAPLMNWKLCVALEKDLSKGSIPSHRLFCTKENPLRQAQL